MLSDIKISQQTKLKPITEIAKSIGIEEEYLELYGKNKAKISLNILEKIIDKPNGIYINVTAITPTPLGEGKTLTTIGLSLGLNKISKKTIACIRQPSLGPVFGIKGGAAGGGYSQVIPMEDFNLHLTGDMHAVSIAHNLCAAYLDNSILKKNKLNIDPLKINWKRVIDLNDRTLRHILIGLGGGDNGTPRETGFDITPASEIMAILALSTDLKDLRKRLGRIVVATDYDDNPVTAEDLKVAGAMAVLLKDAIKPNLMQTTEHTPCFIHAGPFANIAHGNSSIIADKIALKLADCVVTESGFGADCGTEKFFDIKNRYSGLVPNVVVIVCTVRALKMHSGGFRIIPGKSLDENLIKENLDAIKKGSCNLEKHIENLKLFGIPIVVAINKFSTDTQAEIDLIKKIALNIGADEVAESEVWEKGGEGGIELAKAVMKAVNKPNNFKFLYPLNISIKEKIEKIAKEIYGAQKVKYSSLALQKIKIYTKLGYDNLPICMAKTHLSISHDPLLKGRPQNFILPIQDIKASIGAGFLYPLCGEMKTMPGLPSIPCGTKVDLDENDNIIGLF
ncbi:MAG: formate--tetrahydrofolate ligase [bacterium]